MSRRLLSGLLAAGLFGGVGLSGPGQALQAGARVSQGRVSQGSASFVPPAGWRAEVRDEVRSYQLGEASALLVGVPQVAPADPAAWVEERVRALAGGEVVQDMPVERPRLAGGAEAALKAVTTRTGAGNTVYVGALVYTPQSALFVMLITQETQQLAARLGTLSAVLESVRLGAVTAGAPAGGGGGTLPALAPMNAAQFVKAGGDPERQLIPDEFRCYAEVEGSSPSPELRVQILPGGHYRTAQGGGNVEVSRRSSLDEVRFSGGPLAGADGYLRFDDYGQKFSLSTEGEGRLSFECYQRGARENLALRRFKLGTPKEGRYPCVVTDGSGRSGGTLEILAGGSYRLGGGSYPGGGGRYRVDFRSDQDDDDSRVEFAGGPLGDQRGSYSEDDLGVRRLRLSGPDLSCQVVAQPAPPPRSGPDRAPALPQGSGGLSGAYAFLRPGALIPTISGGLMSECPGNLCWRFRVFSKNGYVYTRAPESGLEDADCTRTLPNGLPVCEVYRVQGGQIVIGQDKPVPFKVAGQTLVIDGDAYAPIAPLSGLRLGGSYTDSV